jgi:hypothetical protein
VSDPLHDVSKVISPDVRVALYHRLHWLWPLLAKRAVRRGLRLLGWGLLFAWLAFAVLLLALRYAVLPKISDYQTEIEQAATQAVGQPVKIGRIEAHWKGLNPDLVLENVEVADHQGAPAFSLAHVEGVLSWQTLWRLRPRLSLLAFDGPVLHVRRDANGKITVAGMDTEGESDPAFAEWVLEQKQIRIRDATIVWEDQLRKAPPLVLEDLQFALDNSGRHHRFGLSAAPPDELASRVDVRGEVKGISARRLSACPERYLSSWIMPTSPDGGPGLIIRSICRRVVAPCGSGGSRQGGGQGDG